MSEPFIGEIKMLGFNYAPSGWAQCDGQILPIAQHYSLYALLGNTYGGDGQTTFGLPDMRGRIPVHMEIVYYRGYKGGIEQVPLAQTQLPIHTHAVKGATASADAITGSGTAAFTTSAGGAVYGESGGPVNMENGVIAPFEGDGGRTRELPGPGEHTPGSKVPSVPLPPLRGVFFEARHGRVLLVTDVFKAKKTGTEILNEF